MLVLVACGASAARAQTGCADGTREGLTNAATYPRIAGCEGVWTGFIGSESANGLCATGWHVCSPAEDPADAALVGSIGLDEAQDFEGCFAFNASHDYGNCQPCTGEGGEDDLAGMGSACANVYSDPNETSCLGSGRIDAENGSECAFDSDTTDGVVCCQARVQESVPAMSSGALMVAAVLLLLVGFVTFWQRRDAVQ